MKIIYEGRDSYGSVMKVSDSKDRDLAPDYWITVHDYEDDGDPSATSSIPISKKTMKEMMVVFIEEYRKDVTK